MARRTWSNNVVLFHLTLCSVLLSAPLAAATDVAPHAKITKSRNTKIRTIQLAFSAKYSAGSLYQCEREGGWLPAGQKVQIPKNYLGEAKGTVSVPSGRLLYLFASYDLINHPEILNNIPVDALTCITFGRLGLMVPVNPVVPALARMTGVKRLELEFTELSDNDVARLNKLTSLEDLSLEACSLNGTCFQSMPALASLRLLNLSSNHVTPAMVRSVVKNYPNLDSLNINRAGVTDDCVPPLLSLKKLKELSIAQSRISAKSLPLLAQIKTLEALDLSGDKQISTDDLRAVVPLHLHVIYAPKTVYSPAEMQRLKAMFPRATIRGMVKMDKDAPALFAPLH